LPEAGPGARLLRVLQRFMQSGMAMARRLNHVAERKVKGQDFGGLSPAGFDATLTNALVVQAVAYTAALRARLRALVGQPLAPLVPEVPPADRAFRGRGKPARVTVVYEVPADEPHDWVALTQPLRIGPSGVAVTLRLIAHKSNREVVTDISDFLRGAVGQLGTEADVPRIAALEATARALCDEIEAAEAAADADAAAGGVRPEGGRAASDQPGSAVDDDPPARPPDG